jgi:hypothetical protein
MSRVVWAIAGVCLLVVLLAAQQRSSTKQLVEYPEYEVRVMQPREISPARYLQVSEGELDQAAREGWELVAVVPFALANEERGNDAPKAIVTQTYPAFYFKRLRR